MPRDNEKKNIITEINKTGFPLELRVSKFLQDNGYRVANNLYYIDQDEGKGREVDMRALKNYKYKAGEKTHFIRHCLLIECKRSAKKPWVVFSSPQSVYDRRFFYLQCRGVKKDIKWVNTGVPKKMGEIHPFSSHERRGRSFFEPFKNIEGGGNIYKSLITSVKAAIAMRNNAFGARAKGNVCIYYPVIIFDGKLYEAYLDDKNKINTQEVDSVIVSFYYESPKYEDERFLVPIMTERYLPTFCSDLNTVLQFFGKFFRNNMGLFR